MAENSPAPSNKALQITSTSSTDSNAQLTRSLSDVLKPETAYSITISAELDITESSGTVYAQVIGGAASPISVFDVYEGASQKEWAVYTKEFSTSADIADVSLTVVLYHAAGKVRFDNIAIYEKRVVSVSIRKILRISRTFRLPGKSLITSMWVADGRR